MSSWPWQTAVDIRCLPDPRDVVSRISLGSLVPRLTLRVAGSCYGPLLVVSREVWGARGWPTCNGNCKTVELSDAWIIPGFSAERDLVLWVRQIVVSCLAHEWED